MYRTSARVDAEPDDAKRLWEETKAEVRRRRLDERLRFLTGTSSDEAPRRDAPETVVGPSKPDVTPNFRGGAGGAFVDWCFRTAGTAYLGIWLFENISGGWLFAIAMVLLSFSFVLAGFAVERAVLELRRFGKLRNRSPIASFAMLAAGAFAWWNAIWWSDLHKEASDFGSGSTGLQVLEMALWVALALIAARRNEWTPRNGPDAEQTFNSTEAFKP